MKNPSGAIPTSSKTNEQDPSGLPAGVPKDFRVFDTKSRFVRLCGPMYEKIHEDNTVGLGLLLDEQHLNQLDLAHGGILMTLADNAMGRTLSYQSDWQTSYVTLSMNSQFMQAAKIGEFIHAKATVQRKGRRLVFLECEILSGDKVLFYSSATFAVMGSKK